MEGLSRLVGGIEILESIACQPAKKMDLSTFPVVVHRNYHLQPLLN